MKITKEDKTLYKFLEIAMKIFGKSESRSLIIGKKNMLYFFTEGYGGKFVYKNPDELIGYDFGNDLYELRQTPKKNFVLELFETDDAEYKTYAESIIHTIDTAEEKSLFSLEVLKAEDSKLAKIAVDTGVWLKDEDIAYLKPFDELQVRKYEDMLVCKSFGLSDNDIQYAQVSLIFTKYITGPTSKDASQMKMDVEPLGEPVEVREIETTEDIEDDIIDADVEEIKEEFEDEDDDPMS